MRADGLHEEKPARRACLAASAALFGRDKRAGARRMRGGSGGGRRAGRRKGRRLPCAARTPEGCRFAGIKRKKRGEAASFPLPRGQSRYRRFCACQNGLCRNRGSQAAESAAPAVGEAAVPAAANGVNAGRQKNRVLKTKGGGFAFLLVFYCSGDGLRRAKSPAEMQLAQGFTARTSSIIGRRISSRMPGCASSASGGCASRTVSRQNPCDNRPINSCVSV